MKRNWRERGSEKLVVLSPGEKDTRVEADLLDRAVAAMEQSGTLGLTFMRA